MQPDMQACSPAARVCRRPTIDYFYLWTRPKKRSIAFPKVSRRILIGKTSLVSLPLSPIVGINSRKFSRSLLFFKNESNIVLYTLIRANENEIYFCDWANGFLSFYFFSWTFYIGINSRFRKVSRFVQVFWDKDLQSFDV